MAPANRSKPIKVRGHYPNAQSRPALTSVIQDTVKLWRKHHLDYDQTKYVVE